MPPTDGFTLEIEDATAQQEMQDDVPESEIADATAQEKKFEKSSTTFRRIGRSGSCFLCT